MPTLAELERIRERVAKEAKAIKPEPIVYSPWADFRVYRCTGGNIVGLFKVTQVFSETTGEGKNKRTTFAEKQLAEGVDMHIVECAIRKAMAVRLNKRRA